MAVGDPEAADLALRAAQALWRGPTLADCGTEAFAVGERTRVEELRLRALEDRIDADLALGRHGNLVGELKALAAEHPLRERLCGQLMLALYRSGRQGEASDAHQRARGTLAEERGMEPGPALQALLVRILDQDPTLEPTPGGGGSSTLAAAPKTNLPVPVTTFVGLKHDVAELRSILQAGWLLTLTGSGGVGKTRLALEVAGLLLRDYPDGVWLADLGPIAQHQGWQLGRELIYEDDGYSGARLDRPALDRLRDSIVNGAVDMVLITSPDRLARRYAYQVWLMEELERAGVQVIFLERPPTGDPQDALVIQIRGVVAEYERTVIADRMRRGRLAAPRAGRAWRPDEHIRFHSSPICA